MNKKTISLITIHGIINHGSALQTFATVKAINKLGYDCVVINYKYPTEYHTINAPAFKTDRKPARVSIIKNYARKVGWRLIKPRPNSLEKKKKFKEFLTSNLKFTKLYDSQESILNDPPLFDIYVSGSDQIWNPKYLHDDTAFLLHFAPETSLKVSYASSFGASSVLEEYKEKYRELLKRYDHISVREVSGIRNVKELTGKDAVLVLDPTLLLSPKDWEHVAVKKRLHNRPYILCYLLSYSFNPYPYTYKLIGHLRKITGYDVIFIGDCDPANAIHPKHKLFPNIGPPEFLSLFRDASFVVTTSFHGTTFSINYSKPFFTIVDEKKTLDDRQLSIARLLNAEGWVVKKGQSFPDKSVMKINYARITRRLKEEREKSINFLASSLT